MAPGVGVVPGLGGMDVESGVAGIVSGGVGWGGKLGYSVAAERTLRGWGGGRSGGEGCDDEECFQ